MGPFQIGNLNNPPFNNINGNYVNKYDSTLGNIHFSSNTIPNGSHTLPPTGNNVQSALGIYPSYQKAGKINRYKINKISSKYKMKGSKKTIKKYLKRIKSKIRSKYIKRYSKNSSMKKSRKNKKMYGGTFQQPMTTPNYPNGYTQYQNNVGSLSNVYSLGSHVSPENSYLANPPPQNIVTNANLPDNLNHNTLNSNGNIGSGSGFISRGSF